MGLACKCLKPFSLIVKAFRKPLTQFLRLQVTLYLTFPKPNPLPLGIELKNLATFLQTDSSHGKTLRRFGFT